jgi:hypothetical protein
VDPSVIGQPDVRCHRTEKHVIVGRAGPLIEDVVGERADQQIGQRHGQRVVRLLLHDPDRLPAPVDVGQPQVDDVARA